MLGVPSLNQSQLYCQKTGPRKWNAVCYSNNYACAVRLICSIIFAMNLYNLPQTYSYTSIVSSSVGY